MQSIVKEFAFEAAHILPSHPGKCSRLHGHSYKVEIGLTGEVDSVTGFVMDFADLKNLMEPIIKRFDHQCLNWFIQYPSAENIACHIAHELYGQFNIGTPHPDYLRFFVRVQETEGCAATWDSIVPGALDRFEEGKDDFIAGWRSPLVTRLTVSNIPDAIERYKNLVKSHILLVMTYGIQLEQLRLYRDSMGEPGEIFRELEQYNIEPRNNEKAPQEKVRQETAKVEEELEEGRNE